ncbi:glycoside hydrolase family 36 N-terminal domain-containing protein [Streptomyces sp. NPDC001455]|uniref:glycoside hydrolase family 36 N-terminal domain-containing protein n=1 Tax=unclassified Streptomyces TaxID=2593676 RepID=UPI00331EB29F
MTTAAHPLRADPHVRPTPSWDHSCLERLRPPRVHRTHRRRRQPRHLYWGPALNAAELEGLPDAASPAASSFEADAAPDELAPQTGARFGPTGFQVRFADGTRGAQWHFTGHHIEGGQLRLRLADRHYPLTAELCYRVRPDSDVIERWTGHCHVD